MARSSLKSHLGRLGMRFCPEPLGKVLQGRSDLGGFGRGQGILSTDTQVPYRALRLRMVEQDLHGPQIAGPLIDEGNLGPAHAMGAVG